MKEARWVALTLLFALAAFLVVSAERLAARQDLGSTSMASGSPLGYNFAIHNDSGLTEVNPAVAYNSQRQEYLAVWYNDRPGNDDVRAQRISKNGALVGGSFYISAGVGAERHHPDVAYNSQDDEYLVVWESCGTGYDCGIHARLVSGVGQVLAVTDTVIATGTLGTENDLNPAVSYASTSNKYLVVWEQETQTTYSRDIRGRVVSASGTSEGSSFIISWDAAGGYPRSQPDLAYNRSRNEYLVVWQQWASSEYDVYGRRVTGNGYLLNPESIPIINSMGDETAPSVAAIPTIPDAGEYLVAWEQDLGGDKDIRTRHVAGDGTTGTIVTVASTLMDESNPAVTGNESNGQYLVAWTRVVTTTPSAVMHIYGQAVSIGGGLLGLETYIGEWQADHAAAASGPLGDFVIVFDDVPLGGDRGIYGQLWGNQVYLPLVVK